MMPQRKTRDERTKAKTRKLGILAEFLSRVAACARPLDEQPLGVAMHGRRERSHSAISIGAGDATKEFTFKLDSLARRMAAAREILGYLSKKHLLSSVVSTPGLAVAGGNATTKVQPRRTSRPLVALA